LYAYCETVGSMAEKGLKCRCIGCNAEVLAKCGLVRVNHWARVAGDCDPWSEPESESHIVWKLLADEGKVEVTMPPHRADIIGPNGTVVELQYSHLPAEDIAAREKILWAHVLAIRRIGLYR
jgi:competence protein CoiA